MRMQITFYGHLHVSAHQSAGKAQLVRAKCLLAYTTVMNYYFGLQDGLSYSLAALHQPHKWSFDTLQKQLTRHMLILFRHHCREQCIDPKHHLRKSELPDYLQGSPC